MEQIIMAGIVTYNPDVKLLMRNINSVTDMVSHLIICDNGSDNIKEIENISKSDERIKLISLNENKGIAYALNRILTESYENNASWVITLDQDSIVPHNLISDNNELLDNGNDIAIISCVINDRNEIHKNPKRDVNSHYSDIESCITSASITNVEIWRQLGGFDEYMFIDEVDIEYCLRARMNHYKIVRNNNVQLSHAIGNIKEKRLFGKWITIRNHSAFRKYYQIRNQFYMHYKLYGTLKIKVLYRLIAAYLKVIIYESDKNRKLKMMNLGVRDGLKSKKKVRK